MNEPRESYQGAIKIVVLAFVLALALGTLEIALRLMPSTIGLTALSKFEPGLRAKIAGDLGLRTRKNLREIPSSERTDGGPPIFMVLPLSENPQFNEQADLDAGASEVAIVDELGFCNERGLLDAAPFDVVVVGDSFTFCTSVQPDETVAPALGQLTGLRVYNLGVSGVGPNSYLELLKAHTPMLQPRVTVMSIYEGNDLRDAVSFEEFKLDEGPAAAEAKESTEHLTPARSYALQFLNAKRILTGKWIAKRLNPEKKINFRYSTVMDGSVLEINSRNKDRDEVEHALAIEEGRITFGVFETPIRAYRNWGLETGIVTVVAYIPSMYTAYAGQVDFEDPEVGEIVNKFSADQRAWFEKFTASLGIPFVDLTPHFQKAATQGELTHFPGNVHLTPAGHRVVAENIRGAVTQAIATSSP